MRITRITRTTRVVAGVLVALLFVVNMVFGPGASRARGASLAAAPLQTGRASHAATLLPDGKVLAAGGFGSAATGGKTLTSAEVYDPASNKWTATKPLATPRKDQTATLLPDGRVLVVGGSDGNMTSGKSLNSVEIFNEKTQTWTGGAPLATPRTDHTATLLPDGKVLVTGGYDTSSGTPVAVATAEIYDPVTNKWTGAGTLGGGRANASASLLPDGKVMVVGGETSSTSALASAEVYDPATNTWTGTKALAGPRTKLTTTTLPDGRVLAVGGDQGTYCATAELYNPKSNTWTGIGSLNTTRQRHTATLLPDGRVMIVGGDTPGAGQMSALASRAENSLIEIFQPDLNAFEPGGEIPGGISNQTVTLLPNGMVLITGGVDSTGAVLSQSTLLAPPPPTIPTPTATIAVATSTTAPLVATATTMPAPPTATTAPPAPTVIPTATNVPPAPTATSAPAATHAAPTATIAPTVTPVPPTATVAPTATSEPAPAPQPPPPPTATPPPPTPTFAPIQPVPTATPVPPTATPTPATGTINGTVTCNPPVGSYTSCSGPSTITTDTGQSATAGPSGTWAGGSSYSFTLTSVPAGSRTVTAAGGQPASQSQTVTVPPGGSASVSFSRTASYGGPLADNPYAHLMAAGNGAAPDDVGAAAGRQVTYVSSASNVAPVAAAASAPCAPAAGQPAPSAPSRAATPGTGGSSGMPRTGGGGGQSGPIPTAAVLAVVILALGAAFALTHRPRRKQPVAVRPGSADSGVRPSDEGDNDPARH